MPRESNKKAVCVLVLIAVISLGFLALAFSPYFVPRLHSMKHGKNKTEVAYPSPLALGRREKRYSKGFGTGGKMDCILKCLAAPPIPQANCMMLCKKGISGGKKSIKKLSK